MFCSFLVSFFTPPESAERPWRFYSSDYPHGDEPSSLASLRAHGKKSPKSRHCGIQATLVSNEDIRNNTLPRLPSWPCWSTLASLGIPPPPERRFAYSVVPGNAPRPGFNSANLEGSFSPFWLPMNPTCLQHLHIPARSSSVRVCRAERGAEALQLESLGAPRSRRHGCRKGIPRRSNLTIPDSFDHSCPSLSTR